MSVDDSSVQADIQIKGLPDLACFTSFGQLLRDLPNYLQVNIPTNITNVIVSNTQPAESQRNTVWFRMSNGGVFIGIYLFSEGTWRQFFPVPDAVYRVAGGDSRNPPAGYILTDDAGNLTQAEKDHLKASWLLDPTGGFYVIFDVVPAPT